MDSAAATSSSLSLTTASEPIHQSASPLAETHGNSKVESRSEQSSTTEEKAAVAVKRLSDKKVWRIKPRTALFGNLSGEPLHVAYCELVLF